MMQTLACNKEYTKTGLKTGRYAGNFCGLDCFQMQEDDSIQWS